MQIYQSKGGVEIHAFQFLGKNTKTSEWFPEYFEKGVVQISIDCKKHPDCMTIYQGDDEKKVYLGEWLCKNAQGTLFKLTNNELTDGFVKVYNV